MGATDILFELISVSLGHKNSLSGTPDESQWKKVFQLAKKQALLGVLSPALDLIPRFQRPQNNLYLRWMLIGEKIVEANAAKILRAKELYHTLDGQGIRSCILKGSAFAEYYPDPSLRQSGDIDIWIEGGYEKVLHFLAPRYEIKEIFYHHCAPKIYPDVEVEAHFMPSWMNCPTLNRRLQNYYATSSDVQFSNFKESLGFSVPTPVFACFHAFVHTFRHLYQEGVGLRQVMDCYHILNSLSANERVQVAKDLRNIELQKFASAMMFVLNKVFGLTPNKFIFAPDASAGEFLLKDIISSGNFGFAGKDAKGLYSKNFVVRSFCKARRIARIGRICPPEALWAPYFKIWQKRWMLYFAEISM